MSAIAVMPPFRERAHRETGNRERAPVRDSSGVAAPADLNPPV
jgi:hypothetical protein